MTTRSLRYVAAALAIACPLVAQAQDNLRAPQIQIGRPEVQQQQQLNAQNQNQQNPSATIDAQLAACLIVDNQNEVALAQLALQRAQSDEVKKFAQQMVQDHQQLIGTLQQFASGGRASQTQSIQPGQRDTVEALQKAAPGQLAQANQGQPITSYKMEAADQGGHLNLVALKQELGAQCLQSARRELEEKQGADFDKCYMGMQIGAHMGAIDMMQVAENHASPELKKKLSEGIQTAQGHFDHAKQIVKSLETAQAGNRQAPGSR